MMPLFDSVVHSNCGGFVWSWNRSKPESTERFKSVWKVCPNILTGITGKDFLKIWPGNLQSSSHMAFLFSLLSGLLWGNLVDWTKEDYAYLLTHSAFFLSFCLCTLIWWCTTNWVSLIVSASPQLTFHGEKENVNLQFDSFVFFLLWDAAKLLHIQDLQLDFLKNWSHAVWLFLFLLNVTSASCFYNV